MIIFFLKKKKKSKFYQQDSIEKKYDFVGTKKWYRRQLHNT